jgi:Tat protein secretion system quality control protein TatD with DNase activity
METKEILLETDAPFLPPYPECKINHPWNLEVVAQEVSRLRNVPLSMLMTAINQNTIQFYGWTVNDSFFYLVPVE